MKSTELPDDWIVETSKSLPNRVYYFNTRTKKSSWEFPVENTQNAGSSKSAGRGKKRKTEEGYLPSEARAVTPEMPKKTQANERRTLKAKRTTSRVEKQDERAQNEDTSKDTPQMRLLREKMAQRQAKGNASRRSKIIRTVAEEKEKRATSVSADKTTSVAAEMRTGVEKTTSDPGEKGINAAEKSRRSSMEKGINATAEKTSSGLDLVVEAQNMTPQMRVLLEKMKDKKSKSGASKVSARKSLAPESKLAPLRRPKTTRSIGSAEIVTGDEETALKRSSRSSSNNSAIAEKGKTSQVEVSFRENVNDKTRKSNEVPLTEVPKKSRLGRSARKNLAQERLEKLQRSLTEEQTESRASYVADDSEKMESAETCQDDLTLLDKKTDAPPSIYKNADMRAKFLRERLQNKLTYEKKMKCVDNIDEESTKIAPIDTFCEEMEWEPIEDDKITQEILVVRSHIFANDDLSIGRDINSNSLDLPDGPSQEMRKPSLYIVIDTNVFLSNLSAIEEARDAIFKNYGRPLIVVPWTVIRELDFIKDDKSMSRPECLRAKARQAVRFLHQHFSAKHPRVLGQTPFDVENNRQKFMYECPDDEILQTCLQIRLSDNNVVLLSYDKNLCNKAMIHDLVTLGRHDPLEKVDFLHASDAKNESFLSMSLRGEEQDPDLVPIYVKELRKAEEFMESAKDILTSFMTVIVVKEMQNFYSEDWQKFVFIQPPWSVTGVLKCAIKHWIAAVSNSFIRRAESLLKELFEAMNINQDSGRKLSEVSHILEMINDLLQCVKAEKHPNVVAQSARAIADLRTNCAETCKKLSEEKLNDSWKAKADARAEEERAARAFQQFEEVYAFARDICGLSSNAIGMPCSFLYKKLNPEPSLEDVKEMQPEVAANLNRLLQVLGTALEEINGLHVDHRSVEALYHALSTFMPDFAGKLPREFSPLDVYWCIKKKEKVLRLGLSQLQELSSHFCRMASFRCT